jgi:hypothetical protein
LIFIFLKDISFFVILHVQMAGLIAATAHPHARAPAPVSERPSGLPARLAAYRQAAGPEGERQLALDVFP